MEQHSDKNNHPIIIFSKSFDIRMLLNAYLSFWNFCVIEAANENELIHKETNPLMILFDVSLRLEDDLNFLRRLRADDLFKNTPILVLTGHARAEDAKLVKESGADEYFIKPINFELFEQSISKYSHK